MNEEAISYIMQKMFNCLDNVLVRYPRSYWRMRV